jgi:hypothetical protein
MSQIIAVDQKNMAETHATTNQNNTAQLGCGTLILIAIIVVIFSGRGDVKNLQNEIRDLRMQVTRLEGKVDALNARLAPEGGPTGNL